MAIASINALPRDEKAKKARAEGFIPAIIYGKDIKPTPVKFEEGPIKKVIHQHGERAKVKVHMGNEESLGVLKAVDRHPTKGSIVHMDIQLVKADQKINWEIPVVFNNTENLDSKKLILQINMDQIEVSGTPSQIPDKIEIDVADKEAGDTITIGDLKLPEGVEILKETGEPIAVITYGNMEEEADDSNEESVESEPIEE